MQFRDFKREKEKWITFVESSYYPDYLDAARREYTPFLERFNELLKKAASSQELLDLIMSEQGSRNRIQLLRIFRRYVSPDTSVEMLKVKQKTNKVIKEFGSKFRSIEEVRGHFRVQDDVLICLLHEYEDRGTKGYEVSAHFFDWFRHRFGKDGFTIEGPTGAGGDIYLTEVFSDYPRPRPTDFIIKYRGTPVVVGFIRYDSDRGGAQEDDRTGGYRDVVTEILSYSESKGMSINILFVNEGPGLTLGSMWEDYSNLEEIGKGHVLVVTLKMLESRLTKEWLLK